MQTKVTLLVAGALLLGLEGACGWASSARAPRLRLGHPRVVAGRTIAVPVELVAGRGDHVVALNFTLRHDPVALAVAADGVIPGRAIERAGAQFVAQTDPAVGTVRALVVPAFSPSMPALRGRRVATIHLEVRGPTPRTLGRWVRRRITLERVVLSDPQGREIRAPGDRRGR